MLGLGPAPPFQILELRSITALHHPANRGRGIKTISGIQESRISVRFVGNLEIWQLHLRRETRFSHVSAQALAGQGT